MRRLLIFFFSSMLRVLYSLINKESHWIISIFLVFPLFLVFIYHQEEVFFYTSIGNYMRWTLRFLSFWIIIISLILISQQYKGIKLFVILYLIIILRSFLLFNEQRYFTFYVIFEVSVLPILLITLIRGRSSFRLEARMYLLWFTLSRALILFFCISSSHEKGIVGGFLFLRTS